MSLLSGLLGPAINVATRAAGDYQGALANRATADYTAALQRAQIVRQQQEDAIKQAVADRQAQHQALVDRIAAIKSGPNGQLVDFNDPTKPVNVGPAPAPKAPVPGSPEWRQMKIDEARIGAQYGYHAPQHDQFQSVTATDPGTNATHLYRFNTHTGQYEDSGLGPKPAAGKGGSASGAQVPVADMKQRFQEIQGAANDLAQGKWNITRGMQAREGTDYGLTRDAAAGHGILGKSAASAAMELFNVGGEDYPKYQSLMNSTRALGDDVAKVFKGRQNEESVLREVALSQLTPQDYNNPQAVKQKLDRLQHIIDLAELNNPDQHIAAPSGASHLKSKYGLE